MTDDASSRPLKRLQDWFDSWRSSAQDVLTQVCRQPVTFEAVSEPLAAGDSDLRYPVKVTGTVEGEMALRLSGASAIRLARKFVGAPAPSQEDVKPEKGISEEDREALEELLRQISGLAATTVGKGQGGSIHFTLSSAEGQATWTSEYIGTLRTRDDKGIETAMELIVSPALATALLAREEASAASASRASGPLPTAPGTNPDEPPLPTRPPQPEGPSLPNAANECYRRLFDVGLGVKLRFGTRRMLLRDVLALSSGLVVELDNELNSPVDLLLDGRVIARGEVVVIDGKYGLRVTDIVDPLATTVQQV